MEISVSVDGGKRHSMTFGPDAPINTVIGYVREIVEASRPKFEAVQFGCSRCGFEWTRQSYVNCPQCKEADYVRLKALKAPDADAPYWYKGSVALLAEADVALRRHVDRHGEWFEVFKSRDGTRLKANEATRSIADLHLKSGDRVLIVQA